MRHSDFKALACRNENPATRARSDVRTELIMLAPAAGRESTLADVCSEASSAIWIRSERKADSDPCVPTARHCIRSSAVSLLPASTNGCAISSPLTLH